MQACALLSITGVISLTDSTRQLVGECPTRSGHPAATQHVQLPRASAGPHLGEAALHECCRGNELSPGGGPGARDARSGKTALRLQRSLGPLRHGPSGLP